MYWYFGLEALKAYQYHDVMAVFGDDVSMLDTCNGC